MPGRLGFLSFVALRKESVDRNDTMQIIIVVVYTSLSARRAWIEIYKYSIPYIYILSLSARRAWIEIMDDLEPSTTRRLSLSARRAWIEILCLLTLSARLLVALRKESVDRNSCWLLA